MTMTVGRMKASTVWMVNFKKALAFWIMLVGNYTYLSSYNFTIFFFMFCIGYACFESVEYHLVGAKEEEQEVAADDNDCKQNEDECQEKAARKKIILWVAKRRCLCGKSVLTSLCRICVTSLC